jgi:hypothetical protein
MAPDPVLIPQLVVFRFVSQRDIEVGTAARQGFMPLCERPENLFKKIEYLLNRLSERRIFSELPKVEYLSLPIDRDIPVEIGTGKFLGREWETEIAQDLGSFAQPDCTLVAIAAGSSLESWRLVNRS